MHINTSFCNSFKLKNLSLTALTIIILFIGFVGISQTKEDVHMVTSFYDQAMIQQFASEYKEISRREKQEAINFARKNNLVISQTAEDGSFKEIQRILPNGTPLYYITNNKDASISTRTNHLNSGGSTGYNLNGQNMKMYVWDGGHPRISHQEFDGPGGNDRVGIIDGVQEGGIDVQSHPTHVVGTIGAYGLNSQAKGMAPEATVKAYKWNDDLSEAAAATLDGMLLSNHSYGYESSYLPDYFFGAYSDDAVLWDNLMYYAPYFLMVCSAGNDGNNNVNGTPLLPGYDKLNGFATAKNNLVVAASQDAVVSPDGELISVARASFSSQGPTDDLRIKPDITGNGYKVYSTLSASDSSYGNDSGTSMSAPNVSGTLLLLQQHYHNLTGNFLKAATLKGLVLHTADDAGLPGPDALWGWGLLNAKKAAESLSAQGTSALVNELVLTQGQTITFLVDSDQVNDLKVSISWTDPAGSVNNDLNSAIPALVNDLDLRVSQNGTTYYPWKLVSPNANSNSQDNSVDPFERIDIGNASGTYAITINHKGTLKTGRQNLSLVVTGIVNSCLTASIPQNLDAPNITAKSAELSWDMISGATYDVRYRKLGMPDWIEIPDLYHSSYLLSGLYPYTKYEFQVRSRCPAGPSSAYSSSYNFTTLDVVYCRTASTNPSPIFYLSRVELNTLDHSSSFSDYSDFTAYSTSLQEGMTYAISLTATTNDPTYYTAYSVWIDYDGNGIFDDPGEEVFTTAITAGTKATGSFTVPSDLFSRSTRMRVSLQNSQTNPGPCDTFTFGEVEDYTINLIGSKTEYVYDDLVWHPLSPIGISTIDDNIRIKNGNVLFNADVLVNNLVVEPGATAAIQKMLTIGGDIVNDGNLIFLSDATQDGELAAVPSTSNISGNVIVHRYMSNRRSYRMVSSAVSSSSSIHTNWQEDATANTHDPNPGYGTHITGTKVDQANGFDATDTGTPSMYKVVGQQFIPIQNTDSTMLHAGAPFLLFVRGGRDIDLSDNTASGQTVLRSKGVLATGTVHQTYNTSEVGDFAMFGNPYQSTVDVNSLFSNPGTSSNINKNHFYIYDPQLATFGAYVTVNLPSGSNSTNGSSSANQFLQAGQAAQFVTSGIGASILEFKESDKVPGAMGHTNTNAQVLPGDKLTVQLYTKENFIKNGPLHDSFTMNFHNGYQNEITSMDAVKPMNFYENIARDHDGNYLSLEYRDIPEPFEVFPLYSSGYAHIEYTFNFILEGLSDMSLYLYDLFTGEIILIPEGVTDYAFEVDPNIPQSMASDRFFIRTQSRMNINGFETITFKVYPNPFSDELFFVQTPSSIENVQIRMMDLGGRIILDKELKGTNGIVSVHTGKFLKPGVYLVTVESLRHSETHVIIKK